MICWVEWILLHVMIECCFVLVSYHLSVSHVRDRAFQSAIFPLLVLESEALCWEGGLHTGNARASVLPTMSST